MARTHTLCGFAGIGLLLLQIAFAAAQQDLAPKEDIADMKTKLEAITEKQEGYKDITLPSPSKPPPESGDGKGGPQAYKKLKEFEQDLKLEKLDKLDQIK